MLLGCQLCDQAFLSSEAEATVLAANAGRAASLCSWSTSESCELSEPRSSLVTETTGFLKRSNETFTMVFNCEEGLQADV